MKIIDAPVSLKDLWKEKEVDFVEIMKIVVDVDRGILAIDAEMHADLEQLLLQEGSEQQSIWGANVYPGNREDDLLEFTSFINIRPSQGNRSMEVQDPETRKTIHKIVHKLLI